MDLHMHSTCSDGALTPLELLKEAKQRGVSILSITDHDAIDGYHQGQVVATELGIYLIPGIELNTDGPEGELHILGYHFRPNDPSLLDYIEWRVDDRKEWSQAIVRRLQFLGYPIEWDSCLKRAQGGVVVRTHLADELVSLGCFPTSTEAYETLLKKGAKGYVPRSKFTAQEAIDLIHQIGGIAFLAHPGIYDFPISLPRLVDYGLDGIEVYHSKHRPQDCVYWEQEAERFGLRISGGSDYHGPQSRMPYPIGSVQIPDHVRQSWTIKRGDHL